MRVAIVGAGPAGLYLAILLKKADRDVDVSVFERNARRDVRLGRRLQRGDAGLAPRRRPGDAPGDHGHVRSLGPRTSVTAGVSRSQGHSFSAIARKRLLEILQRRCFSLGVDLAGVEVAQVPATPTSGRGGRRQLHGRRSLQQELGTSVPAAASTSGSGPTSSSTPSRSSSARPSMGSSRCTPTRSTSARARSSSSAREDVAPGRPRRARRGRKPRVLRAAVRRRPGHELSRTARSGSTSRRS